MASQDEHKKQAAYNCEAAQRVEQNIPDWAITMCFYAALHYVETYAIRTNVDIKNDYPKKSCSRKPSLHEKRRDYIEDLAYHLRNRNLRKAYSNLEKESKNSRYINELRFNSREYYQCHRQKVTMALQNLQIIRQLLS